MKEKYIYKLRGLGGHHTGLISQVHRQFKSVTRIQFRSVAQSGSAPGLGPGGPKFESLYSDHFYYKGNIMTCRGYDPKAVKLSKAVKRAATLIRDAHVRGAFIRSFIVIEQSNSRSFGGKGDKK